MPGAYFVDTSEASLVLVMIVVEHLEKSSPLIIEEVRRWRDLLWDDYLNYQYQHPCQPEVDDHNILPTPEKP